MKTRILIYIAVVAMSSVFVACSDDMLDKKPLRGVGDVDVFSDGALLKNFVNGMYVGLRHPFDDENSFTDGLTDNAFNRQGSAESTIKVYTRGEVSQDNGEGITRNLWVNTYKYIRNTNLFFANTENSPIDAATLQQLTGEVRFLRAFFYFDLMRWYGGVPLITKVYGLDDDSYDVTRNTPDEIAAFIVSECDKAINELTSISGTESGRASKEAAMALKARTLLYIASPLFNTTNDQARWTAARDANKAVMDLSTVGLIGSDLEYGKMFRGESTKEVILARYFTSTVNQGWGVNLWLYSNSYGGWSNTTPTQDLVDNYELTNGKAPSDAGSGYDDQDPYVNRDPRFYQSILYNGAKFKKDANQNDLTYDPYVDKNDPTNPVLAGKDSRYSPSQPWNSTLTGYNFRKWTQESVGEYSGNTGPWIIFRTAEFYLNYAEAQIALGNEDEARTAITAVRGRVGMPAVVETGAALVDKYRRERRTELVLEDHRFFDIRRWKIGPDALDKDALGVNVVKNGATFEYDYGVVVDGGRKWDDKMYLLPIPSGEIQRSHNALTQNPGYVQ